MNYLEKLNKKIEEAENIRAKTNKLEDIGFVYGLHQAKLIYEEDDD